MILNPNCPKHKTEKMFRLVYNVTIYKKPTRENKRGVTGERFKTNWFYCEKCDYPYFVEIVIKQ